MTLIAVSVVTYCLYKIRKTIGKIVKLKQGRDGERALGQYWESLREPGVKVFHDLPGDNFNLNHVLVAPSGVYIIETKTYSKPDKGEARIIYTGDTLIHHNGFKDDKPLIQVKAGANWLKQLIKESTGRDIDVKGVAKNSNFLVSARKHRADDCMDAEGRAMHGAIVENWNVF